MKDTVFGPVTLCFALILIGYLALSESRSRENPRILSGPAALRIWESMEDFRQERDVDTFWREDVKWRCRKESVRIECERKRRRV